MRARAFLAFVIALLATSCGNSRDDHAAQACTDEIGKRLSGRNVALDAGDMRAHVRRESADTVLVSSSALLDKGTPSENRQAFDCRVRFDAKGTASVLYLQFDWSTSDAKTPR